MTFHFVMREVYKAATSLSAVSETPQTILIEFLTFHLSPTFLQIFQDSSGIVKKNIDTFLHCVC